MSSGFIGGGARKFKRRFQTKIPVEILASIAMLDGAKDGIDRFSVH
jgi:hypothetical protein